MKTAKILHRYLYLASVFFFFSIYFPWLYYWAKEPEKNYRRLAKARQIIGKFSSALVGFGYRIQYEVPIDWSKPYIICPNHTSNLDITAMVLAFPPNFSFIGKQELLHNPITGLFFRTIDLPIDRQSKISAFRMFKKATDNLSRGKSILIFPEGGILPDFPPQLSPFKNGAFRMAIETGTPIIPVVIHNAWNVFWDDGKAHGTQPGTVDIDILAPVQVTDLTVADTSFLREQIYDRIASRWSNRSHAP